MSIKIARFTNDYGWVHSIVMQFWRLHKEHYFYSKEGDSILNQGELKSKKSVAGLTNFSQFLSATSSRCRETENSVCATIWTFFGTFNAMRSECESVKSVKTATIESLIKHDVDDGKVKRWRRSLTRISILRLLCTSANLVCSSRLYLNTESPGSSLLKLSLKFSTETGISWQQSVAQVQ